VLAPAGRCGQVNWLYCVSGVIAALLLVYLLVALLKPEKFS
jgi:K+-transporting ATPase KdpF subunit